MAFPEDALSNTLKAYPVLNRSKLKTELGLICNKEGFKACCGPVDLLQLFMENDLEEDFSETVTVLKILITTLMAMSEAESCFSTLKRIITFFRNTMTQETLNVLVMLSLEKRLKSVISVINREVRIWDHSFCRNPDASEKPWCYVIGQDGTVQRQYCPMGVCTDESPGLTAAAWLPDTTLSGPPEGTRIFGPDEGERTAAGSGRRNRTGPARKKDLGVVGYILGIVMMAIIILFGVGITVGYFYKRGRALHRQYERRAQEQELQRLALPFSAYSNPTCQLVDEGAGTTLHSSAEERPPVGGAQPGEHAWGLTTHPATCRTVHC